MASQTRAVTYLEAQKKNKELREEWNAIENLYNQKLWNEMTAKLLELVKNPTMQKEKLLVELYEYFIESFETRLNPFGLVTIMEIITNNMTQKTRALEILEKIEESVKVCDDAVNYVKVLRGTLYLKHIKDFPATKKIIEELKEVMEFEGHVTEVHGKYFMLSAEYSRLIGNFNDYYRSGMLFLACALDSYPSELWPDMAFTLSIAALLGDNVYNVGQLLLNPIMASLNNTKNAWMIDLIKAFHGGNVDQFIALKPKWTQVTDLRNNEFKLREKISLLALMELTFQRSGEQRRITFQDIATAAKISIQNVELLVLKAFALDLVRGQIDQIDGVVNMHWVKPRVLNQEQIGQMAGNIEGWANSVSQMINIIHEGADEIIVNGNE